MKALVVGLGAVGQRHVRNLRDLLGSDIEILAYRVRGLPGVVTSALESKPHENVVEALNVRVCETLEDALAEHPSVAFICNPTSFHLRTALACARGGCDLFIEKPLSHDLEGVRELLADVQQNRRIVMVGYQLRFHPCYLVLKRLLNEKAIGAVLSARVVVGEYLPGWHPYEDYRRMYAARADLGGGVILTQIHEFDYLYALFGMPRRMFSIGGHLSRLEIDVEDVASTLMEFNVGGRTVPVHLHQDYLQRPVSRSCEIIGDCGKIVMDLPSLSVMLFDGEGAVRDHFKFDQWNRNEAFIAESRHFIECVRTRQKPIVDLNDGIASLRMALAAKKSVATGQIVAVQTLEDEA